MGRTVFVSHASADVEIAQQICDYLEREGLSCWIAPRDATPGRDYGSEIIEGILECPVFVLVLSEHANASIYVKREVERAVSAGKPVLPIRVREVMPARSLELFIAGSHWIDAWKPPIDQYLGRLAHAIKGAVDTGDLDIAVDPKPLPPGPKPWRAFAAITAIVLGMLAGAGGWWWYNKAYGPLQTPVSRALQTSDDSFSPEPTDELDNASQDSVPEQDGPVPAVITVDEQPAGASEGSGQTVEAETQLEVGNDAENIEDLMLLLDGTSGSSRYRAIKNFYDDIPEKLTTEQMLAIIGNSTYRVDLLKSLVNHLPETLPFGEALTILKPTSGSERYNTVEIIRARLPAQLSTDQVLAIIGDSPYRGHLLKSLIDHLPETLTVDEALTILKPTSGSERYTTIGIIRERLPAQLSTDQVLAIVGDSSYRTHVLKSLADRLPTTLSVSEAMAILEPTSGSERYSTLSIIAPRVEKDLPSEAILKLVGDSSYRDRAIAMLKD